MEFGLWEKYYTEILDDFGFSRENDEESAKLLDEILSTEGCITLEDLKGFVDFSDKFIVFGAGPSLREHVKYLKENYDLKDYVLVAADGATTALIEQRIAPDIVATDLDGNLDDILLANVRGANVAIHAHGDNIEKIASLTPFFTSVLGTTQAQPIGNLYNFGGFTDGDRAMFLAVALNAEEIILAGMDFGDVVTRYSRPNIETDTAKADEFKRKKLAYGEKLIITIKYDNMGIEDILMADESLFQDINAFDPDYVPQNFNYRDTQMEAMAIAIRPAMRGGKPSNAVILGSPATGKTTSMRKVYELVEKNTEKVVCVYIHKYIKRFLAMPLPKQEFLFQESMTKS